MNANKNPKPRRPQPFQAGEPPLFQLGQIVATPGALQLLDEHGVQAATLLGRHVHGDWLGMDEDDRKANVDAVKNGCRIFSSYGVASHKVWVITEAVGDDDSRGSTCILLPSEY